MKLIFPMVLTVCALLAPARLQADTLQELIDAALADGRKELVIAPGEYRVAPPAPGRPHLLIRGARNLSIVADGVTLICTSLDQAVKVEDADGLTIQGLRVDYDPLPFTQGTVVALAEDGAWIDVKIDAGYPAAVADSGRRAIIHDPATRLVKRGTWTRYGVTIEPRADGVARLSWARPIEDTAAVGDLMTITRRTNTPHAIFLERASNCTLRNVTLHTSTSFGFFEAHGGNNAYLGCTIAVGPTPAGATAPRLLSTQADGIHSKFTTRGPRIENCTLDSMGDDGIAINGDYALVVSAQGNKAVISPKRAMPFAVGDRLHGIDLHGAMTADARILSITPIGPDAAPDARAVQLKYYPELRQAADFWKQSFTVELDAALPLSEGHLVASPDRNGSGFVVRNNTLRNTRARGILVKASDGVIEANTIEQAKLAGIVLCPETVFWLEADYSRNVAIRNNALRDIGFGAPNAGMVQAAAITVCSDGLSASAGHQNITIEGNTVERATGVNLLIASAQDVRVRNNRFIAPHLTAQGHGGRFGIDPSATIWITQARDVRLEGNQVVDPGPHAGKLVVATESAQNIKVTE